jgi:putative intracellular protease/amidase
MAKILILSTATSQMGGSGKPTGVWFEELATPYYVFRDAGHEVTVATLGGKTIPIDPNSDATGDDAPASVARFRDDRQAMATLEAPSDLGKLDPADFHAVYVPGGHGAMWDLAESEEAARFLSAAWNGGKVVASVCHGPAAFVEVRDADGEHLVKGRTVSAFTDSEERGVGLDGAVPFLLESRLRDQGAVFESAADWQPHAVADGRLITGQNPASSAPAAKLVLEALAA